MTSVDIVNKLGRKISISKKELDQLFSEHDASYYDEEQFIQIKEITYVLRGRSRTEELTWEYNEWMEVSKASVGPIHENAKYVEHEDV